MVVVVAMTVPPSIDEHGRLIHDGEFGERLKWARARFGWTQKRVIEMVGREFISRRTIQAWEQGHRPRAGIALERTAAALQVTVQWLLWGDEED